MPRHLRRLTLLQFVLALQLPVLAQAQLRIEGAVDELRRSADRLQLTALVAEGAEESDATATATWSSSATEVATVDDRGWVAPQGPGETTLVAEHAGQRAEFVVRVAEGFEQPVDFAQDIVPVLTRAGCASGACHAAQHGQGGLKLSLLGYAPEQDHPQLVRDRLQRRISLVAPEDSLLLTKPTLQISHGGGQRIEAGSYEYELLRQWIAEGAAGPQKDSPAVTGLEVSPGSAVYASGQSRQLQVVAVDADGSRRDVTACAIYDSLDDSIVEVDARGRLTTRGSGQSAVMIRYRGQAKISTVIVPAVRDIDVADFEPANFVDELVLQRWRQLRLQPSPLCSDQEFVRRVFLDVIGTLPPPERVRRFLASDAPDKREQLVDELLGLTGDPARDVWVGEWSAYWALKWGDLIRNNRNKLGDGGMWALYNWTRASLRENKPVDRFVQELITAQGSVFESGPANFYKITNKADELAEATAQTFLGVRLQVAKCHHHPFEVYSQADYYGLAAFFTRVSTKSSLDFGSQGGDTVVMVKRAGSIKHPRTGQVMAPRPLLGEAVDSDQVRDLRRPLALWLTAPDNRLFARNIANRFWGYLMGSGLVEPIDDMRATNPASNPELLDALADHLVENQFDLRRLMRAILTSRTYQLSSAPAPGMASDTRFYTHYNVRRLPAEVMLDAIDFACGTQEKFSGTPAGTRAIELPDPNFASYFLDTLGRPQRVITCECERTAAPNLAQVLHLANGDFMSRKITDKNGRVAKLTTAKASDDAALAELYWHTLSRPPSADELAAAGQVVAEAPDRSEGLQDVLWALCNTREFLFNH